jgi:outer membrane protein OmpU
MKNILYATTALVATAGIASADVSISGFAEVGIFDTGNGDMQLFNDIDVTFSMTGETEGGISFGASVDLDEISDTTVNAATDNNSAGGIAANISGSFGTVTLGDTDGASDWAMTETAVGGALNDDHTAHAGYSGNSPLDGVSDGQILRWNNTVGAMGVAVSFEQAANGATSTNDDTVQIGLRYSMDAGSATIGLGIGYADAGTQGTPLVAAVSSRIATNSSGIIAVDPLGVAVATASESTIQAGSPAVAATSGDTNGMGISLSLASGNLTGVLNYSDGEVVGVDTSHVALGLGVTMDALTVGVNWGEFDINNVKTNGIGVAVNYNLGGGAVFQLGYGDGEGTDTMSMGLALSF